MLIEGKNSSTQALNTRDSACRTAEFFIVDCGIADELALTTALSKDAGAGGAATRRQPQAELNTYYVSWKPAGQGRRQRSPAPKRDDWCKQDTGARPSARCL